MKNSGRFASVVKELSRDPRLKRAIAKRPRGKSATQVQGAADTVLLLLKIVSRFAKKKKARAIDELMDNIRLLVRFSLMLKENIFDRPEVREFFYRRSKQVYVLAQQCVALVLPKPKRRKPALVGP